MKMKIIAIVGPTASGKSDLAVSIAKKFNGEVISADSRQVYKELDIGTGKITKKEMRGIPHYLLDLSSPKKVFNVADFKKLADEKIKEIVSRGKVPILCGGTGFYIDTVTKNLSLPEVPPNKPLREKLEKQSVEKLFVQLQKTDPSRAKTIDKHNKVRIVRAIEIAKAIGKVPNLDVQRPSEYKTLYIGISWEQDILKKRIYKRLIQRIKQGMIKEVKDLHTKGLSWKRMNALGLEYRYIALYLQNKLSKAEMLEKLNIEICHYAKRQMTWFKKNKDIVWVKGQKIKIPNIIQKFLK